jgi:hypothetical protein
MKPVIILLLVALLTGCSKSQDRDANGEVFIRFENETAQQLDNVKIGNTSWGNLAPGNRTEYRKLDIPIYSAACQLTQNGTEMVVGTMVCGTPMPAPISDGYYTFKFNELAGYLDIKAIKD